MQTYHHVERIKCIAEYQMVGGNEISEVLWNVLVVLLVVLLLGWSVRRYLGSVWVRRSSSERRILRIAGVANVAERVLW